MNIDRNTRRSARLLMALPIAALAISLTACAVSRPTVEEVSTGLVKHFEDQGLSDAMPDSVADCFAGYLVDSELSNETLASIANGEDKAASAEDGTLAAKIITDNTDECTAE
ncbi:hypothetical protein [Microbacterium sp.]|uniref:hypothetical protein n=1 Tax=Microbacterium sp. TaxID=51671 RepID=UPI0039E57D25